MTNPTQRKLQWSVLTVLAIFAISIYSCRKDSDDEECCDPTNPECPNYDPCYEVEEPSADFFMGDYTIDGLTGNIFYTPEEEVFRGASIRFRSDYTGSDYTHTWYIGADIYEDAEVTVDFGDVPRPATITISHVLEYPIDSMCFPLSTGIDSVVKSFQLFDFFNEFKTIGNTYRGVIEELETDSFDFRIRALMPDGTPASWADLWDNPKFFRINMHNEGDSSMMDLVGPNNHFFSFYGIGPRGNIVIDPENHEVTMEYIWENENFTFNGRVIE